MRKLNYNCTKCGKEFICPCKACAKYKDPEGWHWSQDGETMFCPCGEPFQYEIEIDEFDWEAYEKTLSSKWGFFPKKEDEKK